MTPAAKFIWAMTWNKLWHRFNCFSLFRAKKINRYLLFSMLGSIFICYFLMYVVLPDEDLYNQWKVYFTTNGFQLWASSLFVYIYFKNTRYAGLATAYMVNCGIEFISAILGFHQQLFWFETFVKIFLLGLALYIMYDIWNRSKKDEGANH